MSFHLCMHMENPKKENIGIPIIELGDEISSSELVEVNPSDQKLYST